MTDINTIQPELTKTRIYREVTFDLPTFDAFQATKRYLQINRGRRLTNSETLRVLILSHPDVDALTTSE